MGVGPDCVRRLAAPPGPEARAVDLRPGRLNLPFFKWVICNQRIFIDQKI